MSNDYNRGYNEGAREVGGLRSDLDRAQGQLADEVRSSGNFARLARIRVQELETALAEAQAAIARKDEQIVELRVESSAMKTLAQAIRDEAKNHPDKERFPIAHSVELQSKIYKEAKEAERAKHPAQK